MKREESRIGNRHSKWDIVNDLIFYVSLPLLIIPVMFLFVLHNRKVPTISTNRTHLCTSDNKIITIHYSQHSNHAVLLVHGYMSSSKRSLHKYYELLRTNGIDVVALDFRNHGLSGLDLPISSGYVERIDIIDTIKWMKDKWEQYVIVATSMGSYATLYALNDIEPDDYPEMISIGSFGLDPLTGIASFLHYKLKVPSLLSEFLVRIIKILKPEYFSRDILNQISALDLPIVISHGVYDRIYPPTRIHPSIARLEKEGLKLYRANTEHSEVWKEPKFQDLLIDAILQSFT